MAASLRLATEADAEILLEMMCEYYAFDGHAFEESRARQATKLFTTNHTFAGRSARRRMYHGNHWLP